ncbi:hypothetical protein [Mucilaginibacter terrae]|uniref:Uncharacterized protein n=1 Tax=Mucilaginibacter terrae TaxID=1955052 RepID=A0ABU3GN68_9SPHI|nr:hypothetical protein [Mucilaginibacter terrae]MDT3401214.1 hypothetical protein [Mucilaginibacter terrae]
MKVSSGHGEDFVSIYGIFDLSAVFSPYGIPFGPGYLFYLFSEKDATVIPDAFIYASALLLRCKSGRGTCAKP